MPGEPPLRRSVLDFCKHHGLSRNQLSDHPAQCKVRPKDCNSTLPAADEAALLRHIGTEKYTDQIFREASNTPRMITRWAPPPGRDEEAEAQAEAQRIQAEIDREARMPEEADRIAGSIVKWRKALIEITTEHVADGGERCTQCHVPSRYTTKRSLIDLDSQLVEEIAVWASGDFENAADEDELDMAPELRLNKIIKARNRWRTALIKVTVDHMLDDRRGRCTHCRVVAPCKTKKALTQINLGIASQIEKFAALDDEELELALGNRETRDYDTHDWHWAPGSG